MSAGLTVIACFLLCTAAVHVNSGDSTAGVHVNPGDRTAAVHVNPDDRTAAVQVNFGDRVKVKNEQIHDDSDTSRLDKNVRTKRSDDSNALEAVIMQQAQQLSALKAELAALRDTVNRDVAAVRDTVSRHGSTFVRWGRTRCPSGTTTLYSGFVGASDYGDSGSGSNRLCLTGQPVFDGTTVLKGDGHAVVTGTQYYLSGHKLTDAVCVVCHTPLTTSFMVPGSNRCPTNTTLQFAGYLTAEATGGNAQAEHVCLDAQPEDQPGSSGDEHPSSFMEHAVTVCAGSLVCPPYLDNKVLTCAICSL